MDKKHIIIIIAVIAVIAIVGGYFLLNNQSQVTSETSILELSKSAYMKVPKNPNATTNADKKGIVYYVDEKDDVNVTSLSNLSTSDGVKKMDNLKNSVERGSKRISGDDVVVYLKDGIYSIFIQDTEYKDAILLQSKDKNLLLQCWESIKFHNPTDKIKFTETPSDSKSGSSEPVSVISAVEKTETAVQSNSYSAPAQTSSSSESYSSYSESFGSSGGSYSSSGSRSVSAPANSYVNSFG